MKKKVNSKEIRSDAKRYDRNRRRIVLGEARTKYFESLSSALAEESELATSLQQAERVDIDACL